VGLKALLEEWIVDKSSNSLWGGLILTLTIAGTSAGAIYVDETATTGAKNGTSWADAYIYLQDALAEATTEPEEIRVAQGTYKPDQDSANPTGSKQRTATFQLISGVEIYGGFPAGGGQWQGRDPNAYLTILTGDLNGDDGPDFTNNQDNSYHVVTATGTSATAVLDGFMITSGNADAVSGTDSYGGGIYNDSGNAVIANCKIAGNRAALRGGGMYNDGSSAKVTICTFSGNLSGSLGGAIHNLLSDGTVISKCTFIGNSTCDGGGGIYNYWTNSTITNCTFLGNTAQAGFGPSGGAVLNEAYSYPVLTNCRFTGNQADFGGAICSYDSDPCVLGCTLAGNSADNGGGMYGYESSPTITNCIFWANTDGGINDEDAQIYVYTGTPVVAYSCIQGLDAFAGSGNIDDNPLFVRDPNNGGNGWGDDPCTPGVDEADNDDYGDLRLSIPSSPCVDNGSNAAVPADAADLDEDGNTAEQIPWDLDGNERIIDGNGNTTATVDMGAFEFARANIVRWPAQFTFFVSRGGFESGPQSLYISNSGAGQLNWEITCDCNWMSADPNSGSSTADTDEVFLNTNTSNLTWGSYLCQLTISSSDAVNSPQTVGVDLHIIKGDFDADGDVNLGDFGVFALAWLTAQGEGRYNPVCDIAEPSNDFIDEADLAEFAENWLGGTQ